MERLRRHFCHRVAWIVLSMSFLNYTSCASPPDDRLVTFSGFLEDYSGFRPASDESKAWTHRKTNLTLTPYTKIMVDSLVFWADPEADKDEVNAVDQWQLKLIFQKKMEEALKDRYLVVKEPGPEVIRLRSALTKVTETRPHSHLATPGPILPTANDVLLRATETLTSTRFLVGHATLEAEFLDSQSQERLIGYIETRESNKTYVNKNSHDLGPIVEILEYWTRQLGNQLTD